MKEFTMEDVTVLYEDNHLLVVVKPQNLPVQADETQDLDLLTLLKTYLKEKYQKPGNVFLGLVHRLDRPTGGVMVFAKNSKSAKRLSEAIREGNVEKEYLTVLAGSVREKKGTLVNYLKKNPNSNTVMIVPSSTEGAKRAELDYEVLEEKFPVSLVKVLLKTGRSHQIRVQFAGKNAPVFGDARYGKDPYRKGFYLALWAYRLCFDHPVSGERMVFLAYPPQDREPWKKFALAPYVEYFQKSRFREEYGEFSV